MKVHLTAIYLTQVQHGDTFKMALIARKAVSLSLLIPLRLGGRRRERKMGQNGLKRFTGICVAGQMAWQWKTCRKADSGPEGPSINIGIRQKRAWLCIQASSAAVYIITPDNIKTYHWCTHTDTSAHIVRKWKNIERILVSLFHMHTHTQTRTHNFQSYNNSIQQPLFHFTKIN